MEETLFTVLGAFVNCKVWDLNEVKGKLNLIGYQSLKDEHVLQLISCLVQSADLNPIELVWDELGQKVRAKQPTSVAHLLATLARKLGRIIFSLTPVFGGKNAKNL